MMYYLGRFYTWLTGWRAVGPAPPFKKYVLVGAPHTSNWDVPAMLAVSRALRVRPRFIVKHTLFFPPLGWILRAWGAVPVDRRARHHAVAQIAQQIEAADEMALLITPEGTRSHSEYWKSGFYYIALEAKVPIVLGFIDYREKAAGFGHHFMPTGDIHRDMAEIARFYEGRTARHPDCVGPVRVRHDAEPPGHSPGSTSATEFDAGHTPPRS